MGAFGLCFVELALHDMMSMFFLSLAWLVHMHVSHDLGQCACACSVGNNC